MSHVYKDVQAAGERAGHALFSSPEFAVTYTLEPGNGTRYVVTIADHPDGYLIALTNFRVCVVLPHLDVHWSYLAEKLLVSHPDAEIVAGFLTYAHETLGHLTSEDKYGV